MSTDRPATDPNLEPELPDAPEVAEHEDPTPPDTAVEIEAEELAVEPASEPTVEEPAEPTVDEPAAAETPVEEPAAVEPAADEPAAVEPAVEEPSAEEPAGADAVTESETPATETETSPAAESEPAPEPAAEPGAEQAAPTPTPSPSPRPVPVPRPPSPGIRPAIPTPAALAATPAGEHHPPVPVPPALTEAEAAEASRWGRVDDDGTVYVREGEDERAVGQYPGASPDEALAFYVRRYADLHAKVALFEARLGATDLAVKEIDSTLKHLGEELAEPAAVGDLETLRQRLETLRGVAAERRAQAEAERAAAKAEALAARTVLVEAAEKIAATDPERMQWKPAGEELRTLLEQWKEAQRSGPRVDRASEDALWKRFSHARSAFDRERRRWFAELEKRNTSAKAEKTRIVAEAERLATSTDWGATAGAYRDLMTQWKAAGRASRKDDDALWARFRGAQDAFFAARDAANKEIDAEYSANLEVKLGLLAEAEKLVPVTDLAAAKAALRDLQDRWEKAGKVPRGDVQRVEGRLRAVEQAVRDADQAQWRRTNPETRARAEGAAAQLQKAIAGLEADLESAKASGDARKVADAQAALDARRAWLEQVERAAAEAQG